MLYPTLMKASLNAKTHSLCQNSWYKQCCVCCTPSSRHVGTSVPVASPQTTSGLLAQVRTSDRPYSRGEKTWKVSPGVSQALPPWTFPFADVTLYHFPAPNLLCKTTYGALLEKPHTCRGRGRESWGPWHTYCHQWDSLARHWLTEIQYKLVLKG